MSGTAYRLWRGQIGYARRRGPGPGPGPGVLWTLPDGSYIAVQSMYRGRRKYELVAVVQE